MMDYLHPDVLTLIFARLPTKTLLQCTLVCQSWYSLIKSRDFMIAHLKQMKPEDLFLIRSHNIECKEETYALHCDNDRVTKYADIEVPFGPAYNNYYRIIGSCNGVLCLSDDLWFHTTKIILWNPTIRKWLRLPRHGISLRNRAFSRITGFGFDSDSEDYKVVRITNYRDVTIAADVYVYSMSRESWRNVSHLESKLNFLHPLAPQAFINGTVHWIVSDDQENRNIIVSFKLSSEAFHTMELPGTIPYISPALINSKLKPAVIEGSLALVESDEKWCCIWLMEEYGVCSSWTKKVKVIFNIRVDRFIGVRKNGELLFEIRGDLYSYDPEAKKERQHWLYTYWNPYPNFPGMTELKRLGIHSRYGDYQSSPNQCALHIESYIESLVLLGMQAHVDEHETESEEEEEEEKEETETRENETESGEEETESESEEDETESESGEEETETESEEEETETESMDEEAERKDEADEGVVAGNKDQSGQADDEVLDCSCIT